jgi:hypothetical protein
MTAYTLTYWTRKGEEPWTRHVEQREFADDEEAKRYATFPEGSMFQQLERETLVHGTSLVRTKAKKNTNAWKPRRYA